MITRDPRHNLGTALSHHHNNLRPSIICIGPKSSVQYLANNCMLAVEDNRRASWLFYRRSHYWSTHTRIVFGHRHSIMSR